MRCDDIPKARSFLCRFFPCFLFLIYCRIFLLVDCTHLFSLAQKQEMDETHQNKPALRFSFVGTSPPTSRRKGREDRWGGGRGGKIGMNKNQICLWKFPMPKPSKESLISLLQPCSFPLSSFINSIAHVPAPLRSSIQRKTPARWEPHHVNSQRA